MRVVLGSKGIFPFYSSLLHLLFYPLFVMLRFAQNDTHNIMGYIFVTRKYWDGRYGVACAPLWITFCNPQMMEFCGVCGECVGYIFVTRKY